jgi:hypothetical protein
MISRLIGTFVVLAGISYGQLPTSSVTGSVVDPQGLPVAGAKVTVLNEGTKVVYEATTTSAGEYSVTGLAPGSYSVTVNQAGFSVAEALHNVLNIGAPLVVNVKLQIGSTGDKVEVEGSYERIDTTSAMISDVIQERAVQTLPLNGRNPLNLIALQPGVVQQANTTTGTQVNGGRSNASNLTLDGIDLNEISVPNAQKNVYNLNADDVQEFRVVTHNATAEFGKNSGANIAFSSKTGTSHIRGDAYEYLRNPDFNANQWYNNAQRVTKPDYKMNQFGGDVGGPLPGGKTFWFGSWQAQRFSVDIPISPTVYTASARSGIFRYVVGTVNGQTKNGAALVNPQTGALLPGIQTCGGSTTTNCIASANLSTIGATAVATAGGPYGVDAAMSKFFNAAPLPNLYTAGDGLNTAGYAWNAPTEDPQQRFMGRIDHNIDKDDSVFFRFLVSRDNTSLGDPINGGYETFPGFPTTETSVRKPENFAANYRRVISPHMVNSLTAGVARFQYAFPNDYTNSLFPSIPPYNPANVTSPFANPTAGGISNQPGLSRTLTTLQALDDLSWGHGAHLFSVGFNIRFQRHNDSRSSVGSIYSDPVVNFSGSVRDPALTMTLPTMNSTDLATLKNYINEWMGLPSSQSQGYFAASASSYTPSNLYIRGQRMHQYDSYIQDQWKARRNLMVNLGVRWEFNPPGTETQDLMFLPNQLPDIWSPSNPVTYHPASQFWQRNNLDAFGPRVGVAWDLFGDGKTVIRSGYGIYFDTINTFQLVPFAGAVPGSSAACTVQVSNTSSQTTVVTPSSNCVANSNPTAQISNGYGVGLPSPLIPPSAFLSPAVGAKGVAPQAGEMDQNLKMPTVHEWNLSVQRDLFKKTVLEVAYVGSHAVRLPRGYDRNQLNLPGDYLQSFLTARSNLINCANAAGTSTCGQSVGVLQKILGSTLTTSTATTPLLNGSAAGLASTIDTTYFTQMVAATGNAGYFRPNPQFGTILYMDSSSSSLYDALQMHLRRHETNLDFGVSYTFGKSIDDNSGDPIGSSSTGGVTSTTAPSNIHNFAMDRGRSDFQRAQVLTTYAVWRLPVGKGRKWFSGAPAVLDAIAGGWGLSGIASWMTGQPFSISSGILTANNLRSSRAELTGPIPSFGMTPGIPGNVGPGWIPNSALPELNPTTAPFGIAAPGTYGNQGRNDFTGPRFVNLDMTMQKEFSISDRWKLEMRADAFNIFNHPNFRLANPITAFTGTTVTSAAGQTPEVVVPAGSSSFGSLCCSQAYLPSSSSATGVGEPSRVLQVALRLRF